MAYTPENAMVDTTRSEVEQLKKQLAEKDAAHAADLQRVTTERDIEVARITSDLQRVTLEKDNEIARITSDFQRVIAEKDIEIARITSKYERLQSDPVELYQKILDLENTLSFLTRTVNGMINRAVEISKDESLPQEARDCAVELITDSTVMLGKIDSIENAALDEMLEQEEELDKKMEALKQDEMILEMNYMDI